MIGWGHMTEAYFPVSGLPLSVSDAYLPKIQLCRDAVPTLPMSGGGGKRLAVGNSFRESAAGTWSRLPKAERLTPERPMPRWPSPVTREE